MWFSSNSVSPNDDENVLCINENISMCPIKAYFDGESKLFISLETLCTHPIAATHWCYCPSFDRRKTPLDE